MPWFFTFFLVSGFCSLVYQVVWLRLAMANYGVTTPVVSLVLSLFMAGLGLGSWLTGRWMRRFEERPASQALGLYAGVEALIGLSALAAPFTMELGRGFLRDMSAGQELGSGRYYGMTAVMLFLSIFPWCVCMGATFPVAMAAIRKVEAQSRSSFSYLYLANVLGALFGTLVSAFVLIELLGFHGTLRVALVLNGLLALTAIALARRSRWRAPPITPAPPPAAAQGAPAVAHGGLALCLLFLTGLASMAMEVVWVRQFTPYLGTVVYAFAVILGVYLVSTFAGSRLYRTWLRSNEPRVRTSAWVLVGFFSLLPLATADYRIGLEGIVWGAVRLLVGIGPFCAALGFVTPMLVDRWSGGDPDRAGSAYAINVLGSLIGPLVAGFVLLPAVGERHSLVILSVPLFVVGLYAATGEGGLKTVSRFVVSAGGALALVFLSNDYADKFEVKEVRHDSTATVIATGEGMEKLLLVNGVGITELTPMTKVMAHMPMAWLEEPPERSLVICFGMGTSFRSLSSWGSATVGVELVPSVPELFPYFHDDAEEVLARPRNYVIVDDGRRFLERTDQLFDVITIDPPPPPEAAGSSLLYSVEFYELIKRRLTPDGILAQWCPTDDASIQVTVGKALTEVFPHLRVLRGMDGWGFHYLASKKPLGDWTAEELAARMPPEAVADFLEWGPEETAIAQFERILAMTFPKFTEYMERFEAEPIRDDRPINEYFLLRRTVLKPDYLKGL